MSIYDELKSDHDKAKDVLSQIDGMSSRAAKGREKLFLKLKDMMTAHSRAEERVFYDAIKPHKEAKDAALEGYEEHHVADVLMREISRLDPADDRWHAKFSVLKENLEHHIEEEEGECWEKARAVLSDEEAEELGPRFVAQRDRLMKVAA